MPVCGSRSRKISSARPGSCSISHALTATAWRLSRLEWLKNTRDTLHPQRRAYGSLQAGVRHHGLCAVTTRRNREILGNPYKTVIATAGPTEMP